jgi:hypothetical protein
MSWCTSIPSASRSATHWSSGGCLEVLGGGCRVGAWCTPQMPHSQQHAAWDRLPACLPAAQRRPAREFPQSPHPRAHEFLKLSAPACPPPSSFFLSFFPQVPADPGGHLLDPGPRLPLPGGGIPLHRTQVGLQGEGVAAWWAAWWGGWGAQHWGVGCSWGLGLHCTLHGSVGLAHSLPHAQPFPTTHPPTHFFCPFFVSSLPPAAVPQAAD